MFSDFKLLEFLLCNIACKFKTKPTCFSVQESAVVTDTFDFNYFFVAISNAAHKKNN